MWPGAGGAVGPAAYRGGVEGRAGAVRDQERGGQERGGQERGGQERGGQERADEELRRGTLLGVGAYALWGVLPLYWPLLEPTGALEVLAYRVLWSLVVVGVLVRVTRAGRQVRAVLRDRGRLLRLGVAAVAVAVNWGAYIYGVNSGQVVETSLGYFVNPLVTVLLGVLVLGERLRPGAVGRARRSPRWPCSC